MNVANSMLESRDELWGSIHEAAHAVIARHLGLQVKLLTLRMARIPHAVYESAYGQRSFDRLAVAAAGDEATKLFLGWEQLKNPGGDDARSMERLHALGASEKQIDALMAEARDVARALCGKLRNEILNVAEELRTKRELSQSQIDYAIRSAKPRDWQKLANQVKIVRDHHHI